MSEEQVEDQELVELKAELDRLVQNNIAIEDGLIQNRVQPNPYVILAMRFDMLLNVILDEKSRYRYEIESAKQVNHILVQIREQVKQQATGLVLPNQQGIQVPRLG